MPELTLGRIAELRADMELLDQDVFECGGEFAMVTLDSRKLKALLDAAERGLTQDRKAAAFDALAEVKAFEVQRFDDDLLILYVGVDESFDGKSLLEAVEAMQKNLTTRKGE